MPPRSSPSPDHVSMRPGMINPRPKLQNARYLAVLALLPFVVLAPRPVTGQDALQILEVASERHQDLAGFCAEFRQVVVNDILRQTTRSRGEICQARSDRFEMRFSDPEGDRVVADGRYIWIYLPSTDPGQVFQATLNGRGGQFDLHREFLTDPGERYLPTLGGQADVSGRTTWVLELEPIRTSPFLRARIWIDVADHMVRKLELTEDEGFVRTVELSDFRLDPAVPAERFRFEPPDGVQVIRR